MHENKENLFKAIQNCSIVLVSDYLKERLLKIFTPTKNVPLWYVVQLADGK